MTDDSVSRLRVIEARYVSRSQVRRIVVSDASVIHDDIHFLLDLLRLGEPESCEFCNAVEGETPTHLWVCPACWTRAHEGSGWMQLALEAKAELQRLRLGEPNDEKTLRRSDHAGDSGREPTQRGDS